MTNTALAPMAARVANAYANFAETLTEIAGVSPDTAHALAAFYLQKKLAKLDAGIGRISVKHGAYLDRAAILNAVTLMNAK